MNSNPSSYSSSDLELLDSVQIVSKKDKQTSSLLKQDIKKNNARRKKQTHDEISSKKSQIMTMQRCISSSKYLKIFADMIISSDGIFRLTNDLQQISFGYQEGKCYRTVDMRQMGIINIETVPSLRPVNLSLSQMISLLRESKSLLHFKVAQSIENMTTFFKEFQSYYDEMKTIPTEMFTIYISLCFEYLRDIQQYENPNGMYVYSIGKINPNLYFETELHHFGFSKSYLDLLGIDYQSLTQMFLRQKQFDLAQSPSQISEASLEFLNDRLNHGKYKEVEQKIMTFDGFPLTIKAKRKKASIKLRQITKSTGYFFQMFEIDVDMKDLERLIIFRQNLQTHSQLSLDDFVRKELSLKFEDVEYSVISEEFLDKFYKENIDDLQQLKDQLAKRIEQINRCSYRKIPPAIKTNLLIETASS